MKNTKNKDKKELTIYLEPIVSIVTFIVTTMVINGITNRPLLESQNIIAGIVFGVCYTLGIHKFRKQRNR